MSPFIKCDDIVTVSPLENGVPSIGEVIVFLSQNSDSIVIHRFVKSSGRFYVTKGDNLLTFDRSVPLSRILGKIVAIEREGKLITFGLGCERIIIAYCSRLKILRFCISAYLFIIRLFIGNKHNDRTSI